MSVVLKFCGAAGTVTGSCFWLRTAGCSFLVDCGLFQGTKTVKQLNYEPFPFNASDIDFVLQTHAHIDHSGLLPKLYRAGFSGPVYMTEGTQDLLSFMLPDSGYIQEMEVRQLNRRNSQRGKPEVLPIYTQDDAEQCQDNFKQVDYETWLEINDQVRARYWNAGHILGSASIELEIASAGSRSGLLRILFSGDIGPDHKLFHPDPEASSDFDYVICESTYGGRNRVRASGAKRRALLGREVNDALANEGTLLIPSFAVERTQELLADLSLLQNKSVIPPAPVFVDSPMAIRATKVFEYHAKDLEELDEDPDLLSNPNFRFTASVDESKAINLVSSGAIIMAASGMCEAGRIRHHLKQRLWKPQTTVLIAGFQAEGTLGRLLLDGKRTVKIQGDSIEVRAKIKLLEAYSGHADSGELKEWLLDRRPVSRGIFLVHGEEEQALALRDSLVGAGFDNDCLFVPAIDTEVSLTAGKEPVELKTLQPRLVPADMAGLDWHNDLAQFQIDLRETFEKAADKRSRNILLRRLRRALEDA
ncbi:MAG: MBL fold metallo-hydrolase [Rhizobiales bacterium]|nr:MBL fold metallo-hydrolase [Hyphomicrobiales bacterium]